MTEQVFTTIPKERYEKLLGAEKALLLISEEPPKESIYIRTIEPISEVYKTQLEITDIIFGHNDTEKRLLEVSHEKSRTIAEYKQTVRDLMDNRWRTERKIYNYNSKSALYRLFNKLK